MCNTVQHLRNTLEQVAKDDFYISYKQPEQNPICIGELVCHYPIPALKIGDNVLQSFDVVVRYFVDDVNKPAEVRVNTVIRDWDGYCYLQHSVTHLNNTLRSLITYWVGENISSYSSDNPIVRKAWEDHNNMLLPDLTSETRKLVEGTLANLPADCRVIFE